MNTPTNIVRKISERKRNQLRFEVAAKELGELGERLARLEHFVYQTVRNAIVGVELNTDVALTLCQDIAGCLPPWKRRKFDKDYVTRIRKERMEFRIGLKAAESIEACVKHLAKEASVVKVEPVKEKKQDGPDVA